MVFNSVKYLPEVGIYKSGTNPNIQNNSDHSLGSIFSLDNGNTDHYTNRMNIQSSDKIDKIFKATFELIAEKGIHNTPMSAISKRSAVAAGTIYHYFESKERLINELYLFLKKEMMQNVMANSDPESSYKTGFFRVWMNYYNYLISNPNILSFIEQCSNTPIITDETKQKADAIAAPLIDFFSSGVENKIFKQTSIYLILSLIHGSVVSIAKLHTSGQLIVTEEVKMSVAEYSWKGLT